MYIQNINWEETGLEVGKSYWMYFINEFAMTLKKQIIITTYNIISEFAQYQNVIQLTYKETGKKRISTILLKSSMLFLNTELKIDTDYSSFKGNAKLNFVLETDDFPAVLKEKIQNENKYKLLDLNQVNYCFENNLHDSNPLFKNEEAITTK